MKMQGEKQILLVAKIIWGAMVVALGMYYFIANFISQSDSDPLPEFAEKVAQFKSLFIVLAFVSFGLAFFIPKLLKRVVDQLSKKDLNQSRPTFDALTIPRYVIRLALIEFVAILGLVLVLLTHEPSKIIPYLAISGFGFLISYPSKSNLLR